ncbi:MAG: siderophore-interacting protein, partial [Dehalococcoidia bacterium]
MTTQPASGTARARMWELIRERSRRVVTVPVRVGAIARASHSYYRITLEGSGLAAYVDPLPADAFKLSLPAQPGTSVPLPTYQDGAAQWPAGSIEPVVRAYTVRHADPTGNWLTFDLLDHPGGAGPAWLHAARPGDELGLTGFRVDFMESEDSDTLLVVADPSALPAAATIIEAMAGRKRTVAVLEAPDEGDRGLVETGDGIEIVWVEHSSTSLLDAVQALNLPN